MLINGYLMPCWPCTSCPPLGSQQQRASVAARQLILLPVLTKNVCALP
jgi:hypothetical protein